MLPWLLKTFVVKVQFLATSFIFVAKFKANEFHWFRNILKTITGTEAERKEILKKIDAIEKKMISEMPVFSAKHDNSETVKQLIRQLEVLDKGPLLFCIVYSTAREKQDWRISYKVSGCNRVWWAFSSRNLREGWQVDCEKQTNQKDKRHGAYSGGKGSSARLVPSMGAAVSVATVVTNLTPLRLGEFMKNVLYPLCNI